MKEIVKRKFVGSLICIAVGIILLIASFVFKESVKDELFSYLIGFSCGLFGVGIAVLIGSLVAMSKKEIAEKMEIEANDERLNSLNDKARAITLAVSIMIEAIVSIVCAILGKMEISEYIGFLLSFQAITYVVSFLILKNVK